MGTSIGEQMGTSFKVYLDQDAENTALATSNSATDELLGDFYGTYPYPWQPTTFTYVDDPRLEAAMVNQDIGDWEQRRLPDNPAIWVAGCGTNQALHTALKFPLGTVIGSDVSMTSLDLARSNAAKIGLTNVMLKQESINHVEYREQFDYVISTGVIHHNADPKVTLEKLRYALKPGGILELMVYNRFHRNLNTAFQKAVRIFSEQQEGRDFEAELKLARTLANNFPVRNQMATLLADTRYVGDSEFADMLIAPLEYSYTIESLEALAASCGLEILMPCISTYAKFAAPGVYWNMRFENRELQSAYDSMPDTRRWQITNLLRHEQSPMLWFYLQRTDSGYPRKSEQQICDQFLSRAFRRTVARQATYIRNEDEWALAPQTNPYPLEQPDAAFNEIYRLADGDNTMGRIFRYAGIQPTFQTVNQARISLTTSSFPYLRAVK
ncbi:MAG TPA: class I SAM-dependent methyltransferase [Pyrinomonadaceae bacterium]|nr:class I SAM-dependent methyltransferase [Pyrinomonadaceae bacterium]